jgi:hypothetical protein
LRASLAHRLHLLGHMPAQEEEKSVETQRESARKPEPKKHEEKKRSHDTLSEENPLIQRGID